MDMPNFKNTIRKRSHVTNLNTKARKSVLVSSLGAKHALNTKRFKSKQERYHCYVLGVTHVLKIGIQQVYVILDPNKEEKNKTFLFSSHIFGFENGQAKLQNTKRKDGHVTKV